ncbi:MAG: hypothetical protein ACKOZT_15035 [Cyanobium sp.]
MAIRRSAVRVIQAASAFALGLLTFPTAAWAGTAVRFPRSPAAAYGYAEIHPAWLQGGFWRGRPWPSGWYQTTPSAWATEGMASGHAITTAVNEALAAQSASIAIPNSGYQLNYASVEALPNSRILFFYGTGAATKRGVGECQIGLLNGKAAAGDEALVLNAACIVAYGRGV